MRAARALAMNALECLECPRRSINCSTAAAMEQAAAGDDKAPLKLSLLLNELQLLPRCPESCGTRAGSEFAAQVMNHSSSPIRPD